MEGPWALAQALGLKGPWRLKSRCRLAKGAEHRAPRLLCWNNHPLYNCRNWTSPEGWGEAHQLCPGMKHLVQGWNRAQGQRADIVQEHQALGGLKAYMEDLGKQQ